MLAEGIYINKTLNINLLELLDIDFLRILDYIGTFAFAISGIRIAAQKNFDFFGAYVAGFVTAVGGGTLRDLMLGVTPFWMVQPSYVIITGLALLFAIAFGKLTSKLDYIFFISDAIGISLFTVVGLEKSLMEGYPMWVSIIMGTITGVVGGMLRDVFVNEIPFIFRKDIYAMACLLGGFVYYLCFSLEVAPAASQMIAAISVFIIRVVSVKYGISLPALTPDSDIRDARKLRKK